MMRMLIIVVVGSNFTITDLENYKAKIKSPLNITMRLKNENLVFYSPPPPSSGAVLLYMLNVLKGRRVFSGSHVS